MPALRGDGLSTLVMVAPSALLRHALEAMERGGAHAALVVWLDAPVGVLVRAHVDEALRGRGAAGTPGDDLLDTRRVEDLMTRRIVVLPVGTDRAAAFHIVRSLGAEYAAVRDDETYVALVCRDELRPDA